MRDVFYLAARYLVYHRWKTALLVAMITLIVYLPIGLQVLVNASARQLTERARATPLLIGAKGSPLELVLRSLYFESDVPPDARYSEVTRVAESSFANAIPLLARFRTRHGPIVGTALEYFDLRQLSLAEGRYFGRLGECVLGAHVANEAAVELGGSVISTPESVFDLAGVYPLKMRVVGVLRPTATPDDRAVFVDIKTAWVIAGLAHGHEDLRRSTTPDNVLNNEGQTIVASAAVKQYNEITADNVASFHFHGSEADFPITAVIAVPHDQKSRTLLEGRYLGDDETVQIIKPSQVIDQLLVTVLTVRRYVLIAVGLVTFATLASLALVFMLSLELRRREMETIIKIGGSRRRIASLIAAEIGAVLAAGCMLALLFAAVTASTATFATRWLVQLS